MSKKSRKKQKKNQKREINLTKTIAGGLVGASFGYLTAPKSRKKIVKELSKIVLKGTVKEFGHTTKKKISSLTPSPNNPFKKKHPTKKNHTTFKKMKTKKKTQQY
ncbi:YtxH domain-containing protein [Staphylococcus simulans]|uniref:YtxH domain-containing protein n=1 Tax=Staphylococcus simulans TaxID=1286 RepID=UPI000D02E39E|nr:YtxH domain-containing protein [Staphylococcus simulans]MCE5023280.1 YtxH domain-containing protein [Staphylococcus simulans]